MKLINVQKSYTPEVALESILSLTDKSFSNMVGTIANYFPDLKNMLGGPISHLESLKEVPSSVISSFSKLMIGGDLSYDDFKAFSNVKINVPEGFTGNLKEYSDYLQNSWLFLQQEVIPASDTYYAFLASFASNKEAKMLIADSSKHYLSLKNNHEKLKKEGASYFGETRHNSSSSQLGSCFNDFDEYKKTEQAAKNLSKFLNVKQTNLLCDRIKKISNVIDVIIEDSKERKYDKVSYEAVKGLAVGVYALAEAIEFYSVTYYRITELAFTMSKNIDVMKKIK